MNPNKKQLQEVLKNGNDKLDNLLILNMNGEFELIKYSRGLDLNKIDYVSKYDSFDAGNDYVGEAASNDEYLLNKILKWADNVWKEHQATNRTRIPNFDS